MSREQFEMSKLDLVEERLLKEYDNQLCPDCGVNWAEITDSLYSDGLNREEAIILINNCPVCKEHYDYLLPIYSRLEVELIKGV